MKESEVIESIESALALWPTYDNCKKARVPPPRRLTPSGSNAQDL